MQKWQKIKASNPLSVNHTFTKAERLCSQIAIDWLFDGKGNSFSVFPLRVIFKSVEAPSLSDSTSRSGYMLPKLLISVPKKRFHHAVDRNRIKRLLREAYRKKKSPLVAFASTHHLSITLAFIYLTNEAATAAELEEHVSTALSRIVRTLEHESAR